MELKLVLYLAAKTTDNTSVYSVINITTLKAFNSLHFDSIDTSIFVERKKCLKKVLMNRC